MSLKINVGIFPVLIEVKKEINGKDLFDIQLPRNAYILYLNSIKNNSLEMNILRKYANNECFSDEEYRFLFKLFLNKTPKNHKFKDELTSLEESFGVYFDKNSDNPRFKLIDEFIPQIKTETWELITIDLLKKEYLDIIKSLDFGEINICLWGWKSDYNERNQSLLNAFRLALFFTLIEFLYDENKNNFKKYFKEEYYKRILLISSIWKNKANEYKPIIYVPIFENFYNLEGMEANELIETVSSVLSYNQFDKNYKNIIMERLIEGSKELRNKDNKSERTSNIEKNTVKPFVNYLVEIHKAEKAFEASEILYLNKLYDDAITRAYYSMIHSLKALLENRGKLKQWKEDVLNVESSHRDLKIKLETLNKEKIIEKKFVSDFDKVKKMRWSSDYNIEIHTERDSKDCINKARQFIYEVKRITGRV